MLTIGERIRHLRTQKKLSVRKLAVSAGITPGYLSHIENERVINPSMRILDLLAYQLQTTADYLYHGGNDIRLDRFDNLPEELKIFVQENKKRYDLQTQDIIDLMGMKYRGHQPQTSEGWLHLYNSIKLVIEKGL